MAANLKLKSLRVLHNLSSIDMARILRMNKGSYCMKENGSRKFTKDEIQSIYYYFKMNPEQLVDIFFADVDHAKGTKVKKKVCS